MNSQELQPPLLLQQLQRADVVGSGSGADFALEATHDPPPLHTANDFPQNFARLQSTHPKPSVAVSFSHEETRCCRRRRLGRHLGPRPLWCLLQSHLARALGGQVVAMSQTWSQCAWRGRVRPSPLPVDMIMIYTGTDIIWFYRTVRRFYARLVSYVTS